MRKFFVLMAVVMLVVSAAAAYAKVDHPQPASRALKAGQLDFDTPVRPEQPTMRDTIDFGFYEIRLDGLKYAVRGERWTWDHNAPDPLEGWVSVDRTVNAKEFWRWMSPAQWVIEGNPVNPPDRPAPDMGAGGYVLCGTTQGYADSLGWVARLGYGNNWCQRLTSPTLVYDGSGAVNMQFRYFNKTEASYDYSKVYLQTTLVRTLLNPPGFNGSIGITADQDSIIPALYTRAMANSDFGGGTSQRSFTITLEFDSDGGLSDEDGSNGWDAAYGAWGVDDVQVDGANLVPPVAVNYTFDNNLQGWTASRCPGAGSYMGVAPLSQYILDDPCDCGLFGNVLEFHDSNFEHPDDGDPVPQEEAGITPIVDRKTDIGNPQYLDYNQILVRWDQYDLLPKNSGVHFRPGYTYYPYTPPNVPGLVTWSPRVGQTGWFYTGDIGDCALNGQTATANGVPADCERMKFVYEVISSCATFGTTDCSGVTNFTPIIDNVRIRNVGVANAPAISFETGGRFNDQWGADRIGILTPNDPAYANCSIDTRFGNETAPAKQGDSLGVTGPFPGASTRWEAKLWLRVKRTGPGQAGNATYNTWKNAFIATKGIQFAPPQSLFTWGYMDSTEINGPQRNRFCSQFRENDAMFNWGGGGEQGEGNEIIPDLTLTPGTKVDYFITSNYTCLPTTYFYLPDTAGKFYSEIDILPSYRLDGGVPKFPCVLYVDAFNAGAQDFIENSLNVVLNGAVYGDPIPDPTTWDRYDYFDVASNYKAPMYREDGGNSGATIPQLLGYRAIIINTGTYEGATWPRDWQGIQQWLTTPLCDGNINQQALIADGTSASYIIRSYYPSLLTLAGAIHKCESYNLTNCPNGEPDNDENNCVRINPVAGTPFGPGIPTDIFANWCPTKQAYAVLGTTGTGVGNKYFTNAASGTNTEFAQVINNQLGGAFKFRTVIEDWSYHLLTARSGDDPTLECPTDTASRVNAAFNEIRNSLKWLFNIPPGNPLNLGLCQPADCGTDVPTDEGGSAFVNRLFQNSPNPFNPRTIVKFSLAQNGPAELIIYDVNGRKVKTLVDGPQVAGVHEVVWDGTNDAGKPVASGVFWSKLTVNKWSSNRKMVILK